MPTRAAGRVQRLAAHLEPGRASSPSATALLLAPSSARRSGPHAAIDLRTLPSTTEQTVVRDAGYFPVIARWPEQGSERLVVVFRGGAGHIGIGGRMEAAVSDNGGRAWATPTVVVDSSWDDRNPALGVCADGSLLMVYLQQTNYSASGEHQGREHESELTNMRSIRSADGVSWAGDAELVSPLIKPLTGSVFGKIRSGPGGVLYMPCYSDLPVTDAMVAASAGAAEDDDTDPGFHDPPQPTFLLQSTDSGASWGDPILLGDRMNEGDVLMLSDTEWLFAARGLDEATYTCKSYDGGKSWQGLQQVTDDRQRGEARGEHPPDLTLLGDGSILMLFGRRYPPCGVQGVLSFDRGESWSETRVSLTDDLPGDDTGYPSTARLDDGTLVTVYYSAGTTDDPHNMGEAKDAYCMSVRYSEAELLEAFRATQ